MTPEREAEILEHLRRLNPDAEPDDDFDDIDLAIFDCGGCQQ